MLSLQEEFIKYLNDNYLEIISKDVYKFLEDSGKKILIINRIITDLSALDSDEFEFQFKIKFNADFLYNYSIYTRIFIIEYICTLDNEIKDLKCISCTLSSNARFEYQNELSTSLVPYITREKYEDYALRFTAKYIGKDYHKYPVDVDAIVIKMKLTKIISGGIDSLGSTVFKDCELNITCANNVSTVRKLKKGTIVVNIRNLIITKNDNLERSTTIHECVHWHYHKKAFEILMLLNDKYKYLDCKNYTSDEPIAEIFNLMEAQANALTPIILMNKVSIEEELHKVLLTAKDNTELSTVPRIDVLHKICSEMANTFNVTLNSMTKRLVALSYDEFAPLQNKNKVEHFIPVFGERNLPDDKSRCINQEQFKVLNQNNSVLSSLLKNRTFVYADGYVVFNDKQYLNGEYPLQHLSDYAKEHISECSLLFNTKWSYKNPSLTKFSLITLNRSGRKGVCEVSMPSSEISSIVQMVEKHYPEDKKKNFFKEFRIPTPDMHFSDYLIKLMDKYQVSIAQLVTRSGCSISVIKNYRKYDYDDYTIEMVLGIAAGLRCYPYETYSLLELAGFNIETPSKKNESYRYLVEDCYNDGIRLWNQYLEKKGEHKLNHS